MASLLRRRWLLCALLMAITVSVLAGWFVYRHSPTRDLPYHDSFSGGNALEWKSFGGNWETVDGTMRNDSDERGAKLITGSRYWSDYSIEADVSLLGSGGDAGLLIRTSDEEQGVDAYSGYYAGLRKLDNSLVLGRATHGWMEDVLRLRPNSLSGNRWHHIKLLAVGCQIVASGETDLSTVPATVMVTDKDCIHSGHAGLRSYESGGAWRNVVIKPATKADIAEMIEQSRPSESAAKTQFTNDREVLGFKAPSPRLEGYTFRSSQNTQSVSSLRLISSAKKTTAIIRGNVILTSPGLFVQDNTGGVYVPDPVSSPSLKVGDQVEVEGIARPGDFSPALEQATVRALWDSTPIPPVTVTVSQAATGAFDARFIEVEGRLRGKEYGPKNTLELDFDVGSQSFRAEMSRGRADYLFGKLKPGSLLRLRGVCVVDPVFTQNLTPFVLLMRSTEDIDVLAGPPWWSAGHLVSFVISLMLLAIVANFFYHHIGRLRLHAVLEERERLAHEMHDTLAQSFAGIGFQLEAIRSGVPESLPIVHQQLNLASDLVRHSHEEARRSIASLRPDAHDTSNLLAALSDCAHRMVEGSEVEIVTASTGVITSIPLRITDTLYRIGQEAIANSIRHARPTRLELSLIFTAQTVQLTVTDDGTGFVPGGDLRGFGVRGMRKRAASIAASLQILSTPGHGTVVQTTAHLPARTSLSAWPKLVISHLKEHGLNVESSEQSNSHPRRG